MKTQFKPAAKLTALCMAALISTSFLSSCNKDDDPIDNYAITGNANGAMVVPAVADTGTASIVGTYNPSTNVLTTTTTWTGLSGGPTSGGFYNGAVGANGPAVGSSWEFTPPADKNGSRSDTLTITENDETQLLQGNWYYLLNTTKNPGGEIRGQIAAAK